VTSRTAATGADAPSNPRDAAQSAARSTTLRRLAQLGLLGYALLHLLVAWLAVQLAWFQHSPSRSGNRSADQSGALRLLARSTAGDVLLWVLALGLAGLCLWQGAEMLRHHRHLPPPGRERWSALGQLVKTVGTALMYGYLAYAALRTALGHGQGRSREQNTVRGVLGWPGGQALVVAVAVVTGAIGIYLAVKGLRSGFDDEFAMDTVSPALRRLTHRTIQVGFVMKGVALALVGVVVAWAAVSSDPRQADGLDGALRTVAGAPFGQWLLTVIAAGLAAYAVYCVVRARHPVG
jgi:Domain of Unknown Function (DUF1206)